ncbi:MAG: hypothetical protein QOF76_5249 [Solirubrobacteraceae bacterium]|jgi:AcrR family transcriptional regulator|nr:hypothetical protein [Solirubrobacteraceae bacterium]
MLRRVPQPRALVLKARQESRERIVAAAGALLRDRAYGALTVDDVMREAGFGRTIFYRHFDDLAGLLLQAGQAAMQELYEIERAFSDAPRIAGPEVVRAAIEPVVRVHERHGPLLRAIDEAAATGDERIGAAQRELRERFDDLLAETLEASPHLARHPLADRRETARALNRMTERYLMDTYGREPRVTADVALRTLAEIWNALIHGEPPS